MVPYFSSLCVQCLNSLCICLRFSILCVSVCVFVCMVSFALCTFTMGFWYSLNVCVCVSVINTSLICHSTDLCECVFVLAVINTSLISYGTRVSVCLCVAATSHTCIHKRVSIHLFVCVFVCPLSLPFHGCACERGFGMVLCLCTMYMYNVCLCFCCV